MIIKVACRGILCPIFIARGHFFLDEVVTVADTVDMLNGMVDKEYMNLMQFVLDKHLPKCDVEGDEGRELPNTRRPRWS